MHQRPSPNRPYAMQHEEGMPAAHQPHPHAAPGPGAAFTAPGGLDPSTLQAGGAVLQHTLSTAVDSFKQRYTPGVHETYVSIKSYFAVDNAYVLSKLRVLAFPFRKASWRRLSVEDTPGQAAEGHKFAQPRQDVNAPDLYIPFMGLITFVLLAAYSQGKTGQFTPEVISATGIYCCVVQGVEVLVVRFLLGMMQVNASLLDLCAYTGYKYVALCLMTLGALLFGTWGFYLVLLYAAACVGFFVLKTLASIPPGPTGGGGPPRHVVFPSLALAQLPLLWLLGTF